MPADEAESGAAVANRRFSRPDGCCLRRRPTVRSARVTFRRKARSPPAGCLQHAPHRRS